MKQLPTRGRKCFTHSLSELIYSVYEVLKKQKYQRQKQAQTPVKWMTDINGHPSGEEMQTLNMFMGKLHSFASCNVIHHSQDKGSM